MNKGHKLKVSRGINYCKECSLEERWWQVTSGECPKRGHNFIPLLIDGEWILTCNKCGLKNDGFDNHTSKWRNENCGG
jgi:hypothetical protein